MQQICVLPRTKDNAAAWPLHPSDYGDSLHNSYSVATMRSLIPALLHAVKPDRRSVLLGSQRALALKAVAA